MKASAVRRLQADFQLKTVIQATVLSALLFTARSAIAQGTRSDYERALNLRKITANKVFKQRATAHWLPGNTQFWYRNDLADEAREFILVNAETGTRQPAFEHERLARALAKATKKEIQANRLPIDKLKFTESGSELQFTSHGKRWKCDLHNYELQQLTEDEQITGSLEPGVRMRPSVRTGEETSIMFLNRTTGDVEIYWIDAGRQRRHYTTVRAGGQHRQHTYAGHVWLVTDKAGKRSVVFVATEEAGEAVIDEKSLREDVGRSRTRRRGRHRPRAVQSFMHVDLFY